MIKKVICVVLAVLFILEPFAFAGKIQPDPGYTEENLFFVQNQEWGAFQVTAESAGTKNENAFRVRVATGSQQLTNDVYRYQARGKEGLTLIHPQSNRQHKISIPAGSVSVSRHYLWVVGHREGQPSGFYVIRLIDLNTYIFKSAIPAFFIPTDPALGEVVEVAAKHNNDAENPEEERILIRTDQEAGALHDMPFQEVEDIIKLQLLFLAFKQMLFHPGFHRLEEITNQLQEKMKALFEELSTHLKKLNGEEDALIPESFRNQDFSHFGPEEMIKFYEAIEENRQLQDLKINASDKLRIALGEFEEAYDTMLQNVEEINFSDLVIDLDKQAKEGAVLAENHPLHQMIQEAEGVRSGSHEDSPTIAQASFLPDLPSEDEIYQLFGLNPSADQRYAARILAGIIATTIILRLAVPRVASRFAGKSVSFHEAAAKMSQAEYRTVRHPIRMTARLVQWATEHFCPRFLKSESLLARTVRFASAPLGRLVQSTAAKPVIYQDLVVTADMYRRSFWQMLADTMTVVAGEMMAREWLASPGDKDYGHSIVSTIPFSETHSLWFQYNVAYTVLSNQILGTIGGVVAISLLEKEREGIYQKYLKQLEEKTTVRLRTLPEGTLGRLGPTEVFRFTEAQKIRLSDALQLIEERRAASEAMRHRGTQLAAAGSHSVGQALGKGLGRILRGTGGAVASSYRDGAALWYKILTPSLMNNFITQTAFRGGFNGTMFVFGRVVSLAFLCPIYVGLYEKLYRGWMRHKLPGAVMERLGHRFPRLARTLANRTLPAALQSSAAEFLVFGLGYGLATSFVATWLFVNIYEKNMRGSVIDFEMRGIVQDLLSGKEDKK